MGSSAPKEQVLLTGGSGFIASHILDTLLGEGFSVVVTARSPKKGQAIIDSLEEKYRPEVDFAVVEDVGSEGAFDQVFQSKHKFAYVVHTASPCHLNPQDPVKDILDPAIKGTTGILRSIQAHAPTVKRVVITSSSAAVVNPFKHAEGYSERDWAPFTWEDALKPENTYAASKKFAEKSAWNFVDEQKPHYTIATINNTFTFGPLQRQLRDLEAVNLSNLRIRNCVLGQWREQIPPTTPPPVFTFCDVRDVALAHVRAMTKPDAGGKRFYIVGGHFSNMRIAEIIGRLHPELVKQGKVPEMRVAPAADGPEGRMVVVGDDLPADVYQFDNSRSREILGLEYTDLETSIRDTVSSILERLPSNA